MWRQCNNEVNQTKGRNYGMKVPHFAPCMGWRGMNDVTCKDNGRNEVMWQCGLMEANVVIMVCIGIIVHVKEK